MEANDLTLGSEYIYKPRDRSDTVTVTLLGFVPLYSGCHSNPHNRNGSLCTVEDDLGTVIVVRPEQLRMTAKDAAVAIMENMTDNPPVPGEGLAAVDRAVEQLREERKLPPGPGRLINI